MPKTKSAPSWSDVKTKLSDFDQAGLMALLRDMYAANKDNQAFLHARLQVGGDVLKPYKTTLTRWLCPDPFRDQHWSVAKAKKAITDYKNAIGEPEGLAELMVFYCEQVVDFCRFVGVDDEPYFNAVVSVFEQALKTIANLPDAKREALQDRLGAVRLAFARIHPGVEDDMEAVLAEYEVDGEK